MDRIARIKEFLASSPGDSFLKHALALEYIKVEDDMAARNLFEEILEKEPGYIGSYYHLAKLLERSGTTAEAVRIYETGMEEAKKAGDHHAYNELKAAYEELIY
jgi:Tfp pilus assembly protein PilF